mgnify:FL=1
MAITKVKTLGITDANVTAAKLSTDSVETAKITASNVTNAKLGSDISAAKLTAGTVDNARLPSTISDKTVQATTPITIKGDGSSADGKLILNCSQNTHGVSIAAPPHSAAQSYNLVLPSTAPGANKILQTDGSGNLSWVDQGASGKIGQVVHAVKTDTMSSSTGETWTDVTGLSVSLTPAATSSKILVTACVIMTAGDWNSWRIVDGSGSIITGFVGDADGSRERTTAGVPYMTTSTIAYTMSHQALDSPSSTSAQTYKVQIWANGASTAKYINRTSADSNNDYSCRGISTITAMEILA